MNIVIIDGQSGRMGQLFLEKARAAGITLPMTAVGTNALATAAMLKAGATAGATGENPVLVAARTADIIVGPIGILAADAMLGEITPGIAAAVSLSEATKVLVPLDRCGLLIAGVEKQPLDSLIRKAVETVRALASE